MEDQGDARKRTAQWKTGGLNKEKARGKRGEGRGLGRKGVGREAHIRVNCRCREGDRRLISRNWSYARRALLPVGGTSDADARTERSGTVAASPI